MNNEARIIYQGADFRIVATRYSYILEHRDGEDAMGVERWVEVANTSVDQYYYRMEVMGQLVYDLAVSIEQSNKN